jgi:hypothetical protein
VDNFIKLPQNIDKFQQEFDDFSVVSTAEMSDKYDKLV